MVLACRSFPQFCIGLLIFAFLRIFLNPSRSISVSTNQRVYKKSINIAIKFPITANSLDPGCAAHAMATLMRYVLIGLYSSILKLGKKLPRLIFQFQIENRCTSCVVTKLSSRESVQHPNILQPRPNIEYRAGTVRLESSMRRLQNFLETGQVAILAWGDGRCITVTFTKGRAEVRKHQVDWVSRATAFLEAVDPLWGTRIQKATELGTNIIQATFKFPRS